MMMTGRALPTASLEGCVRVPGDKSISHRALIFGALAEGETVIDGLLTADDVMRTATIMRQLGATVERREAQFSVIGAPWRPADRALYCGNSGTAARLLMGAVAGRGIAATFDGDASLRGRPMDRVLAPLQTMGITATAGTGAAPGRLPLRLDGGMPRAIDYELPKPSAQVKSAVLLAGLGADGVTTVTEPARSRDHTERMLTAFGAALDIEVGGEGRILRLSGRQTLRAATITVPGDPSSAAFLIVAALTARAADVTIEGVLMNPLRTGLLDTLAEMGATIEVRKARDLGGEPVADLRVRPAGLRGVIVPAARAPAMIDEYPVLAIAAAFAKGTTRMEGLAELRVKESDRLAATAAMLEANGISCRMGPDWLEVDGQDGPPAGGGHVKTHHDHRIAMSALILGLGARAGVSVDDVQMIATSFREFGATMRSLGAQLDA